MNKPAQTSHSSEYKSKEFQVDDRLASKFQRFYQDIENMVISEDKSYSKEEIEEIYWSEEVQIIANIIGDGDWHDSPEYWTKKAMALHNNRREKLDEVAQETLDSVLDWLIDKPQVCKVCGRVTSTSKGKKSHYFQVHI